MEEDVNVEQDLEQEETAAGEGRTRRQGLVARLDASALLRRYELTELLAIAVALVLVAALIFSVVELASKSSKVSSLEKLDALRQSAMQAASVYGVYLSSYTYTNLDGPGTPWAEVDAHSTAAYRAKFDKTKTSLGALVQHYKATAKGTVKAEGITSITPGAANVLLYIVQTTTNSTQTSPRTQPLVVQLLLARQKGEWLIGDLIVPS
jgi:hypothetical protein